MFDTLGYYPILFLIIFVTVILSILEIFVTKSTTQFYSEVGFFGSIKYRLMVLFVVTIGGIIIKYQCKKRVMKKKGEEGSVLKEMFGSFQKFVNTIIP